MILTKPEKLSELLTGKSLTFELGFGNGDFLLYLTREYQDHLVIGAEVANHYFLLAFRKLVRSGVNNFLLYRGDGRTLFRFFVPNG
jgi:tRNA G46 methylase TrmB